jgi:hypothetical protein
MEPKDKAFQLCDKIGITEPIERDRFVMGYMHGRIDARIESIDDELARLRGRGNSFPDAETR